MFLILILCGCKCVLLESMFCSVFVVKSKGYKVTILTNEYLCVCMRALEKLKSTIAAKYSSAC